MSRYPLLLIALLGCPNAAPADSAPAERPHAEGCASGAWYADADGDGHGAGDATWACLAPAGTVGPNDDCDDTDSMVYPGAPHECRYGRDLDCDGIARNECDAAGDADRTLALPYGSLVDGGGDFDSDGVADLVMACRYCNGDEWYRPGGLTIVTGAAVRAAGANDVAPTHMLTDGAREFGWEARWVLDLDGDGGDEIVAVGGQSVGGGLSRSRIQVVTSGEVQAASTEPAPWWGVEFEHPDPPGVVALGGDDPGFVAAMGPALTVLRPRDLALSENIWEWSDLSDVGGASLRPSDGRAPWPDAWLPAAAYPTGGLLLVQFGTTSSDRNTCLFDPTRLTGVVSGGAELAEVCIGDADEAARPVTGDLDGDGDVELLIRNGQMEVHRLADVLAGVRDPAVRVGDCVDCMGLYANGSLDLDGGGTPDLVLTVDLEERSDIVVLAGETLAWGGTVSLEESPRWLATRSVLADAIGDIDGDGRGELLLQDTSTDASSMIFSW